MTAGALIRCPRQGKVVAYEYYGYENARRVVIEHLYVRALSRASEKKYRGRADFSSTRSASIVYLLEYICVMSVFMISWEFMNIDYLVWSIK